MIGNMALRPLTLLGIVVSMVSGVVLGVSAFWVLGYHFPDAMASQQERTLRAAVRHVSDNYVETVSPDELVNDAIRGMLKGLDPHSTLLTESELNDLREDTTGQFGGIGIEVGFVDGFLTVISPIDDTPAADAGMQSGDTIVELDHESLKGTTLNQAVQKLRGKPGTPVHLRVRREDAENGIDFDLVRASIAVNSVTSRMLEPGYGYLRISQFQNGTANDVTSAVAGLQLDNELDGLVIDLRNNPGGVLRASVDVVDAFLTDGLIVYTESRRPSSELRFIASNTDVLNGAPIAILINKGSASASEIVAGAMQDHGRAVLIGTTSYGKGSVQSVLPIEDNRAIKLTTARYFTPNGRSIQSEGITPDVSVPLSEDVSRSDYDTLLLARAVEHLKTE